MVAAVAGGTASELTGGKFANGAITGAFSRAFNDELHETGLGSRQLSKNQNLALSTAAQSYLREVRDLTPDQMLKRFPELQTFVHDFGKVEAADYGREILRQELAPLVALSSAKFVSQHILDNMDSALTDVIFGAPIGNFYKSAGYAWDVYSFSNTNSFLVRSPQVILACNINSGCKYGVE